MTAGNDYLHLAQHRHRIREALADVEPAQLARTIQQRSPDRHRSATRFGQRRALRVKATITVHAPSTLVRSLYAFYPGWPATFPTITGVRLVGRRGSTQVLEVDHVEGKVTNDLTATVEHRIELRELTRRYDASFMIEAEPVRAGTRLTVRGDLQFKGPVRLMQPFLAPYARRQLHRLHLNAVKRRAEAQAPQVHPIGSLTELHQR